MKKGPGGYVSFHITRSITGFRRCRNGLEVLLWGAERGLAEPGGEFYGRGDAGSASNVRTTPINCSKLYGFCKKALGMLRFAVRPMR